MQIRRLLILIACMAIAGAITVVVVTARSRSDRRERYGRNSGERLPMAARPLGPAIVPDAALAGRYAAASGRPRLVANLASRAGPYVVSVRQITAADRVRNLLEVLPRSALAVSPIGSFELLLQVNPVGDAPSRFEVDQGEFRVIDDRGSELSRAIPASAVGDSGQLAGGRRFALQVSAPHPQATLLRSIEGAIIAYGPGGRLPQAWPFKITNVPLPTHQRLFGEIRPRWLNRPAVVHLGSTAQVLTGSASEEASSAAEAEQTSTTLPYLRLVLPCGQPTSLTPILPGGSQVLTIVARPLADGNISIGGVCGTRSWHVTIWDREPITLALPRSPDGRRLGLQMNLSRTDEPLLLPAARPIFPAEGDIPAGSLAISIRVGQRPVGPAMLPFGIRRARGGSWSEERRTSAPVRANGQAIIGNLAAGRYRVVLDPDGMSPVGATEGVNARQYLSRRYGAVAGSWHGTTQEVIIEPGRRTYGAALVFEPAPPTASRGR
jgi:hypothetical protein